MSAPIMPPVERPPANVAATEALELFADVASGALISAVNDPECKRAYARLIAALVAARDGRRR